VFRIAFDRPNLAMLAPIFLLSLCPAARADTCPTGTEVISLAGLKGKPLSITFPEDSFGAREQCLVTITDYAFTDHGNAFFIEINIGLSDIAVFRNDILGRASICFASDPLDNNSCAADDTAGAFNKTVYEGLNTGATFEKGFNDAAGRLKFTVKAVSDGRNVLVGGDSDTLEITPVPEPGAIVLMGVALSALSVRRRSRPRGLS